MKIKKIKNQRFNFSQGYLLLGLLFTTGFFFFSLSQKPAQPALVSYSQPQEIVTDNKIEKKDTNLKSKLDLMVSSGQIDAKTLIVFDRNNKEYVYQVRSEEKIPSASLIKVLSAWFFSENIDPNELIIISETALKTPGDSNLIQGAKYYAKDLISLLLLASSNDATIALLEHFQKNENPKMVYEQISQFGLDQGLLNLKVNSLTGLDSEEQATSFITPFEFVLFVDNFLTKKESLAKVTALDQLEIKSIENLSTINVNTNPFVKNYPEVKFSKTGFTKKAEGGIVWQLKDENTDLIILIMGSGFESRFIDFSLINDLILSEV